MKYNINQIDIPSLLVASPQLQDRNFHKTVLLLVEHNADGAFGFVINRPAEKALREYAPQTDLTFPDGIPAWIGGPVGKDTALVLNDQPGDPSSLTFEMQLSSSDKALHGLMDYAKAYALMHCPEKKSHIHERIPGYSSLYPYRFLVGYAGWGPLQLDQELRQGSWLQLPTNRELIFNTVWHQLWQKAMDIVGIIPHEFSSSPQQYLN